MTPHDMEPPLELEASSSDDGPVDISNYIHVEDHRVLIASIKNDHRLTQLEHEKRQQEQIHNNTMLLIKDVYEMSGEKERQLIEQTTIIQDQLANQSIPPPYVFDKVRQSPFHTD